MRMLLFIIFAALLIAGGFFLPQIVPNPFYFYAGYTNFGASAFFGAGAYMAAFLFEAFDAPMLVQLLGAGCIGVILGAVTGYLTLRIQGIYFAIATVALVVVLETAVYNTSYLGGAAGLPLLFPPPLAWFG